MKSKRTKACDISQKVKRIVWERDGQRCIFCGSHNAMPNAHYISRGCGGLGIEQNVVTACFECHREMDQTTDRGYMLEFTRKHLESHYPNFGDEKRIFHK